MPQTRFVNLKQFALGAVSLGLGVLVYALARPAGSVDFLPQSLTLHASVPPLIGQVVGSLPTFTHTLALCLLSAAVLENWRVRAGAVCLAWFLVEVAFEVGQQQRVSAWLIPRIPAWFDQVWWLANSRSYFARGTFDPADILLAATGATLAVMVNTQTRSEVTCNEQSHQRAHRAVQPVAAGGDRVRPGEHSRDAASHGDLRELGQLPLRELGL